MQCIALQYSVLPRGGKPFTMLTGIHDGNRCNYGLGPVPDKDAFVVAVTALLEKPAPAVTAMKVPAL
ncbi:hypothetical protein ACO0LD_31520 [Undibacterium sp. Ji83W]|uniref:hypothetical protein n=1 Tax=Undibacterium sp. Ji83W TaxID=3413043 RepID=UPI003BF130F6